MIKKTFATLVNNLLPTSCVVCKKPGPMLCQACLPNLKRIENNFCTICGIPFNGLAPSHPCQRCLERKPFYDKHRSVFDFNGPVKKLIHGFKYQGAFWMRRFITPYFESLAGEVAGAELIIPIPLHKKRLRERGFNQSLLLSQTWSRILNKPCGNDVLARLLHTPTQTGLKKSQRQKNLKNAFRVTDASRIKNRKILLVDDVHTTGVTLNIAAKALKRGGAAQVHAATIAIVSSPATRVFFE